MAKSLTYVVFERLQTFPDLSDLVWSDHFYISRAPWEPSTHLVPISSKDVSCRSNRGPIRTWSVPLHTEEWHPALFRTKGSDDADFTGKIWVARFQPSIQKTHANSNARNTGALGRVPSWAREVQKENEVPGYQSNESASLRTGLFRTKDDVTSMSIIVKQITTHQVIVALVWTDEPVPTPLLAQNTQRCRSLCLLSSRISTNFDQILGSSDWNCVFSESIRWSFWDERNSLSLLNELTLSNTSLDTECSWTKGRGSCSLHFASSLMLYFAMYTI